MFVFLTGREDREDFGDRKGGKFYTERSIEGESCIKICRNLAKKGFRECHARYPTIAAELGNKVRLVPINKFRNLMLERSIPPENFKRVAPFDLLLSSLSSTPSSLLSVRLTNAGRRIASSLEGVSFIFVSPLLVPLLFS